MDINAIEKIAAETQLFIQKGRGMWVDFSEQERVAAITGVQALRDALADYIPPEPETVGEATTMVYGEYIEQQETAEWLQPEDERSIDTWRDQCQESGYGDFGPM